MTLLAENCQNNVQEQFPPVVRSSIDNDQLSIDRAKVLLTKRLIRQERFSPKPLKVCQQSHRLENKENEKINV